MEATLTRVDYDLSVEGAVATGRAQLTIDVLKDGWVRVPIPQGLLVRAARTTGDPVSLVPGPKGQLMAVLSKRGRSLVILDVVFTVSSSAGVQRLSLPAGASGITRAQLALPQRDLDVKVDGGLPPQYAEAAWVTYASGAEPLIFTWHKKVEERRVELPLRMRGSLTQLFTLGEDSTVLNAEVQIEVLQGSAKQVRVAVPALVTINQVPGALVADWDVKNGELVVNLLDPVEHATGFTIGGELRLPKDGSIKIPLLRLLDAERDTGGVAVGVSGAGEIKGTQAEGLEPADALELGQLLAGRQSPSLAAFRPRPGATARELEVQVVRYAQQAMLTANVEEARYRALTTADGKTLVEARYAVRNNQRDFVKMILPAGAVLWTAMVSGRTVRPGESPDGGVLIPLDKTRAGEEAPLFPIEVLYLEQGAAWTSKGRTAIALPMLDLPISRTGVVFFYPPLFRISPEAGAFHTQPFESPVSDILNGNAKFASFAPPLLSGASQKETQALADRYRDRSGAGRPAQGASVQVPFPALGPSIYFVSELTGEGTAASIQLSYQKTKDGGVR